MASVQTPVRQPFGVLDSSKLRNLQSIKNRQNALAPSSAPSLKRRHVALDLSDSENVDPISSKESASKRTKMDTEDNLCKPSTFTLKTFGKPKSRLSTSSTLTPRPSTPTITTARPEAISSAPAAAGRSPTKSKRPGILSNRRTRLNAPTFGTSRTRTLSLAAAVNGTLANKKHPKRRTDTTSLEDYQPKSWFFDIYEETEVQQDLGTMTQSAICLDISDDEGPSPAAGDDEDKENVPPQDWLAARPIAPVVATAVVQQPASRKDLMTEEPRTPLADLNPAEYYADGCDAASVVLVADDAVEGEKVATATAAAAAAAEEASTEVVGALPTHPVAEAVEFNFNAEVSIVQKEEDALLHRSQLNDFLLGASSAFALPTQHDDGDLDVDVEAGAEVGKAEPAEIEIWESGSAKDEAGEGGCEMDTAGFFAGL